MHLLDDPAIYARLDPSGMMRRIKDLPDQCCQAWQQAMSLTIPVDYRNCDQIVILGMGGSAIGGDLLRDAVAQECPVPIRVIRDYGLPADVGPSSLVIGSSYSGETEETLSAFQEASRRGARLAVVAGGGRLKEEARSRRLPLLTIDYQGEPRAALGYGFFLLLGLLHNLGMISDRSKDLEEVGRVLADIMLRIDRETPLNVNPAKQLAVKLQGRLAVVYGAGILEAVARRWKGQINENAKTWAFFEVFPELNHNSVVGYDLPRGLARRILVVLLFSYHLHPRIIKRHHVTEELLRKKGVDFEVVKSEGNSVLSHMMSSVLIGDYVSYYLAILNGVDPTPVESVSFLKERLKSID